MRDTIDLGDGALLRASTTGDADELVALVEANRDHLRPWMPWADHGPEATHAHLRESEADRGRGTGWNYVIVQDGAIVGTVGMHHVDSRNLSAMLGYWVSAAAQGNGLVRRAVAALCDEAFAGGFHRLEIRTNPANERSRAVAEGAGFTFECTAREAERFGDEYRDLAVYALLAADERR